MTNRLCFVTIELVDFDRRKRQKKRIETSWDERKKVMTTLIFTYNYTGEARKIVVHKENSE